MTPLFPAQRAAEEFERVLDGSADDPTTARYAELLDAVEALRTAPEVTPRAEFVTDLRTRLMTAAETDLVAAPRPVTPLPQTRARRRRRLGTAAASLVIVGGSAGMAAAASGALPGDPLYPIKRGIEQVGTVAHLGDANRGGALLDHAATRLDEVASLQARGTPAPDLVARTLDSFDSEAGQGADKLFVSYQADGDTQHINTVRDFTVAQMAAIADLAANADPATLNLLVDAADTVADIDQQARVLCGACGPTDAVAPPTVLSAGAAALSMDNLIARPVAQARADIAQSEKAAREQADRLARLQQAAEETAGKIPQVSDPGSGSTGSTDPTSPDQPLRSVVTSDGTLLPSITTGTSVQNLVSDVTGTVQDLTQGVTGTKKDSSGSSDPVKDLTDTVDDVTGDLLP